MSLPKNDHTPVAEILEWYTPCGAARSGPSRAVKEYFGQGGTIPLIHCRFARGVAVAGGMGAKGYAVYEYGL